MEENHKSSIESWTLLALINRDLDDQDYNNALLLSERLYAIDNDNSHFKYVYAKSLFSISDYTACYTIIKSDQSIPCLNLFAKCCLELGLIEESQDKQRTLWQEGTQAIQTALRSNAIPKEVYWGDELASVTNRQSMPSEASLCNLLGDLYVKLDNVTAASKYYYRCLKINPYKISAYINLCDIAADSNIIADKLKNEIFVDFDVSKTNLSRSPHTYLPVLPSTDAPGITFLPEISPSNVVKNSSSVPAIKYYQDISVKQLRALIKYSPSITNDNDDDENKRGKIELAKDALIKTVSGDIEQMTAAEAYKNKHGLRKKAPAGIEQKLEVQLSDMDEQTDYHLSKEIIESIDKDHPPRVVTEEHEDFTFDIPTKKRIKVSSSEDPAVGSFFLPSSNSHQVNQQTNAEIIKGMNKVLDLLSIIVSGYVYQSLYQCGRAALELQKLDDRQYNTARVLCILGKSYYDASDYKTAVPFFRQAFMIAPWFCDGVPEYSTCLCYLEMEKELNLLAYQMRGNKSHIYEYYITAANWSKCAINSNEAAEWFQKAIKYDPNRAYAYALLGYEENEKNNFLGAKQMFAKSIGANKRSYIAWCGMALAYHNMEEFIQAKTLLYEAARLHPRHPVLLAKLAEVLYELEEYEEAEKYIDRSLAIRADPANQELKENIDRWTARNR
ncbi:uncharacterized protein EV154DRAFT_438092 [Mucor mucedo]|uniref:uncharacterized protein n=1 Tax=Mucor mucedo TaxID=29922 RepID=UPI00221E9CB0|nr:uncharacterized protein EV154DRAFT_438092 [Mucor mucedo]KAI7894620.1 hypothetical protein EV154DRAFT_438092 [Mucor mucedo]